MALDYLQSTVNTSDLTTYTFAAQNLGAEDAGRYIIVCVTCRKGNTTSTTATVTVAGVTGTHVASVVNSASNTCFAGIYIAAVPTGASADIVVTLNNDHLRCVIHVYRATDLSSDTAYDTATSTATDPTMSLDVPDNSCAIGCGGVAGAATTIWTGLIEDNDQQPESVYTTTAASDEFVSAQVGRTITIDFSGGTGSPTGVCASWAFSGGGGGSSVIPLVHHHKQMQRAA